MQDERPVLLIEDDHDDAMIFRRILHASASHCQLVQVQDKEGAILYLKERAVKPRIIVMNTETPCLSGSEFLDIVKQDPTLCSIPVIALTRERDQELVQRCFALGIAGYIIKAAKPSDLAMQMAVILDYWQLNRVPLVTLLDGTREGVNY